MEGNQSEAREKVPIMVYLPAKVDSLSPPDQSDSFDVAILGGGPAGLAAALTLSRYTSLSTVVVERSNYGIARVGETLSPGIRGLLQYLGFWDEFQADKHLPSYGTSAAWGSSFVQTRDFILTPFGVGWHLDRLRFDKTMAAAAEAEGTVILRSARARFERQPFRNWHIEVGQGVSKRNLKARFLFDATGKAAVVARHLGVERKIYDRMIAIVGCIEFPNPVPRDTFAFIETCEYGWWYSAILPGHRMVVAFMTDADLMRAGRWSSPERFWRIAREQRHTWSRIGEGRMSGPPLIVPAFSARLENVAGEDWIASGDAAATVDPLSSSGIARALDSGIKAARAVSAYLNSGWKEPLTEYDHFMQQNFKLYWHTRRLYYGMEHRWPQSPFWHRRHILSAGRHTIREKVESEETERPAFKSASVAGKAH